MQVFKWSNPRFYLCFSPDGDGGASSPVASGDGGAASPAPSAGDSGGASPAPDAGSPAPSSTLEPAGISWDNLGSADDLDVIEVPAAPPAAPVPPVAQPAPQVQPVAPTPQPAAPQTPAAPQGEPNQTTPAAPTQSAPALSPSDPAGIASALEANRDAAIAHLATSKFALTPEDIQELETDAAAFVPKMMGRVMHEAQVSMMKFLAQAVPGMVKQFNTVQTANSAAEDKFFSVNQGLGLDKANQKHREAAFRIAKIYRQANPDMPLEQLISEVGPMVAMAVKAQAAPAAQAVPGSPAAPRVTPFRPAVNGGGGVTATPAEANPWMGLGQNYDEG